MGNCRLNGKVSRKILLFWGPQDPPPGWRFARRTHRPQHTAILLDRIYFSKISRKKRPVRWSQESGRRRLLRVLSQKSHTGHGSRNELWQQGWSVAHQASSGETLHPRFAMVLVTLALCLACPKIPDSPRRAGVQQKPQFLQTA